VCLRRLPPQPSLIIDETLRKQHSPAASVAQERPLSSPVARESGYGFCGLSAYPVTTSALYIYSVPSTALPRTQPQTYAFVHYFRLPGCAGTTSMRWRLRPMPNARGGKISRFVRFQADRPMAAHTHTAQPSARYAPHPGASGSVSPSSNTTPRRSKIARAIGTTHIITQHRADVPVVVEDVPGRWWELDETDARHFGR